jgi:multidrug efflux system membrane fusion protein
MLAAGLLLSSCSHPSGEAARPGQRRGTGGPVPVMVATAAARDVPLEVPAIGNVQAYSTVTVRSQITGELREVHFQDGQEVKAGDPLFTIDPRPFEAALKQAEANLGRDEAQLVGARLEFEREKKLLEGQIASRDDYDKAEAAFHSLEATVMADRAAITNATLNLAYTNIRSPFDGRAGNVLMKAGNIVKAEDDTLVTLNQVHPIYVAFSVPEQQLPAIRKRMKESQLAVVVELPGESVRPRGTLTFIDNAVDVTTGTIQLKATFTNADNVLWPGQFVRTVLKLNVLTNATVVPSQAVQSSQTGDFVFVVGVDGRVEKRPVTTGVSSEGWLVIQNGVKPGETVVTDGQMRLAEGTQVKFPTPTNGVATGKGESAL